MMNMILPPLPDSRPRIEEPKYSHVAIYQLVAVDGVVIDDGVTEKEYGMDADFPAVQTYEREYHDFESNTEKTCIDTYKLVEVRNA